MPDEGFRAVTKERPPNPQTATHEEHHAPGRGTSRQPKAPRGLKVTGVAALVVAAAAAFYGISTREHADSELATWTDKQAIPSVEVAHPDHSSTAEHLVLPGDVQAFYEASIHARVSGYLKSWSEDIGARVHAGQTLATIETPDLDEELAQSQAELATARANSALADLTAKRWHDLLRSNSVSVQSSDEKAGDATAERTRVAAALARVSRLQALESFKHLVAPFDGVVTVRNTDVGALIMGGSNATVPMFKVADMHEMRVYVRVPQAYASQLATGMHATLTEPQYPGVKFPATLVTNSRSVAADSRTVLVELMAPNPDGKLWAGTYAEVDFALPADSHILRVPASALVFRAHGAQLATVTKDGKIAMKDVGIGRNLGNEIEITSGISADDQVVTSPLDTIENGEAVTMSDGSPPPPPASAQASD